MAEYEINPFTKEMERVDAKIPVAASNITADSDLGLQDSYVPVDASAGQVVLTAPLSTQQTQGVQWFISKVDDSPNPVIFRCQGSNKINGESELRILFQWSTAHIMSDGQGNYRVV
jgi:hypothetical protein